MEDRYRWCQRVCGGHGIRAQPVAWTSLSHRVSRETIPSHLFQVAFQPNLLFAAMTGLTGPTITVFSIIFVQRGAGRRQVPGSLRFDNIKCRTAQGRCGAEPYPMIDHGQLTWRGEERFTARGEKRRSYRIFLARKLVEKRHNTLVQRRTDSSKLIPEEAPTKPPARYVSSGR